MRFRLTRLEKKVLALPEAERSKVVTELWRTFRHSESFDFLVYILRDLERQAIEQIRTRPQTNLTSPAMVLHVVDLLRKTFEGLDAGHDTATADLWKDDEEFMPEEVQ